VDKDGNVAGDEEAAKPQTDEEQRTTLKKRLAYDVPDEAACGAAFDVPATPMDFKVGVQTEFDQEKAELISATDPQNLVDLQADLVRKNDEAAAHAYEDCARVSAENKSACYKDAEENADGRGEHRGELHEAPSQAGHRQDDPRPAQIVT